MSSNLTTARPWPGCCARSAATKIAAHVASQPDRDITDGGYGNYREDSDFSDYDDYDEEEFDLYAGLSLEH